MQYLDYKDSNHQIHYDHTTFFYYGDIDLYQEQLKSLGLHVFDVILLAYACTQANSRLSFPDEFTRMCYEVNCYNTPQRAHLHTASLIYFSVKYHLRSKIGIDAVTGQLRKFTLDKYVYGRNKQSMSVFIRPL